MMYRMTRLRARLGALGGWSTMSRLLVTLPLGVTLLAAKNCNDGARVLDDAGHPTVTCTPFEIKHSREELVRFDGIHLPDHSEGLILLDGVVRKVLSPDGSGQRRWLVTPRRVYSGNEMVPTEGLVVVSPADEFCGVSLDVGRAYRIVAAPMNGNYYIWATSVTELTSP